MIIIRFLFKLDQKYKMMCEKNQQFFKTICCLLYCIIECLKDFQGITICQPINSITIVELCNQTKPSHLNT